ncbi:MAG: P1 family peptidase [Anaerovoracaceae bacterium]|nr:P1 family peptidase [Anaerovoracaceae bacterium]
MGLPENRWVNLTAKYQKGERNKITDVPGVTVGHVTVDDPARDIHTGVTAILPHRGNLFKDKVAAGLAVINGFGKSAGLVQVQELGTVESPVIMTNTFSVGTAVNAVIRYMLKDNEDIGVSTGTINCVVTECNDGELNDIRGMHVTEDHVLKALANTGADFKEGAVGAGRGMCCMGIKGGIGSASRIVKIKDAEYTIGAILMSNFGVLGNLRINGEKIETPVEDAKDRDRGSVIIVLATDLPLTSRQLCRVARRSAVGLGRTGSYLGNGSGDIAIAFSTANRVPHYSQTGINEIRMVHDECLDPVFEATAEVVEEAVISSLYHAETVKGIRGKTLHGLLEFL